MTGLYLTSPLPLTDRLVYYLEKAKSICGIVVCIDKKCNIKSLDKPGFLHPDPDPTLENIKPDADRTLEKQPVKINIARKVIDILNLDVKTESDQKTRNRIRNPAVN